MRICLVAAAVVTLMVPKLGSQTIPDTELLAEINKIRAIDNHRSSETGAQRG